MAGIPSIIPVELAQQAQQTVQQPFVAYPLLRPILAASIDRTAKPQEAARTRAGERAAATDETESRPNLDERSEDRIGRRLDLRV